jgi:hypothetical protein
MLQDKSIPILRHVLPFGLLILALCMQASVFAQDSTGATDKTAPASNSRPRPVRNTFESGFIIDDQTVMVPVKGTFEADIQHRMGTVQNGYQDFWGLFGVANIRLGFAYAPVKNLYLGFGVSKDNLLWDGSVKYALLKQTKGYMPVSVTYYGNLGWKTIADPNHLLFTYNTERLSYFNEIMIARKVNDKLSIQGAVSISHQNSVPGYYSVYDSTHKEIYKTQHWNMWAVSVVARYKLTSKTALIVDYDQPLTRWPQDNPHPNIAFGFEFNTSGHSFQIFAGNYTLLNPQLNSLYNANNPIGFTQTNGTKVPGGQFHIGFNISRLWNF